MTAARPALLAVLVTVALVVPAACTDDPSPRSEPAALTPTGDPRAGRDEMVTMGCGSCHRIPGVPNAHAMVGPPLDDWSRRSFIAGSLPNSQENMERWLLDPQEIRPGSAMPDLGLSEQQAADMTAYLFTLG